MHVYACECVCSSSRPTRLPCGWLTCDILGIRGHSQVGLWLVLLANGGPWIDRGAASGGVCGGAVPDVGAIWVGGLRLVSVLLKLLKLYAVFKSLQI